MNIDKKDVIWGYVSLILVQGINIILLPFILIYLTDKELGLWYTFTSIYGLAMLIDFGFRATISRSVSYIWSGATTIKATGYEESINNNQIDKKYLIKLLSSIKFIYYLMGLIVFAILVSIGTLYVFNVTLGELNTKIVLVSWFVYMSAIILNIMFSFWNSILKGIGAIKEYNKTLIIAKVSQIIFSIILLTLGYGILGVTIAYCLSVLLNRIILSRYFYNYDKITKEIRGELKVKMNKEIIKSLLPNTVKTGITTVANYLVLNFPIILSSYFISLEVSGQFGIVSQIVTLCLTISNSYFNTYLSKFNYYRVRNEQNKLVALFKKSIKINYMINLFLFLGVIFLGDYILSLISNDKSLLPIPITILIIVYRFLYNNQSIFVSLLSTKNVIPYYKSFILSAMIIVITQIILLNFHPTLMSIIFPIVIVQLIYNNWYWPLQVLKDLRG